ncbi:unnamed protein product [Caenorhabditis brenneri]
MSEESRCPPIWLLAICVFVLLFDLNLCLWSWFKWRRIRRNRREKMQESKKNKEGETPTEGQKTGTGEQP